MLQIENEYMNVSATFIHLTQNDSSLQSAAIAIIFLIKTISGWHAWFVMVMDIFRAGQIEAVQSRDRAAVSSILIED